MAKEYHPKILIVDDEESLIEGVQDVLELEDYRVLSAHNGQEGLEIFQQERPDLVVADIMMPVMDGYEFCAQVRQLPYGVQVPFIFLTAKGEREDMHRGRMLGADDFLTKPFETEDLLVIIRSRLQRSEAVGEVMNKEMEDLRHAIVRTLSHEFRTPLTFISGYTELLAENQGDFLDVELEDLLKGLQEGSRRLQYLVDSFLFLVSLQTGSAAKEMAQSKQLFSVLAPLRAAVARKQKEAEAKSISIDQEEAKALSPVTGSMAMLTSAFERVVDNAIKFSPEGHSPIRIRVRMRGDKVRVEIADHGIGIAPTAIPHIFNAFEQVNREKREQGGAGLGLAIVKAVVELHNGTVSASSQEGVGTTILIDLPTAKKGPG